MSSKTIITLTGDLLPANTPYNIKSGIASFIIRNGIDTWAKHLRSFFIDSDLSLINLESALDPDTDFVQKNYFIGPAQFADLLKAVNVTHVNVANNHSLDKGHATFQNTINLLRNKQLKVIGYPKDNKPALVFEEKNGILIGIAGMNAIRNQVSENNCTDLTENIIQWVVNKMEENNCGLKILSVHWGDEYVNLPSPEQISLAHYAIDIGIDIIHGHHPHVIQPVERYKNGIIMYSLGNFIFDSFWSKKVRTGLLVKLEIDQNKKIEIYHYEVRISSDYLPEISDNEMSAGVLNKYQKFYNRGMVFYEKKYKREKIKNHLLARLRMKIYLFFHLYKMDKISRTNFKSIFMKKFFK